MTPKLKNNKLIFYSKYHFLNNLKKLKNKVKKHIKKLNVKKYALSLIL